MTVKELIETLKTCDENANVVIEQWDGDTFGIGEEDGYEVTYPDGYKSWSPAKEFEKAYYKLEDPAGDVLQWAKYGLKK